MRLLIFLIFFANDTAGNVFNIGIIVNKELSSSSGGIIPFETIYLKFAGGVAIIALILIKKKILRLNN